MEESEEKQRYLQQIQQAREENVQGGQMLREKFAVQMDYLEEPSVDFCLLHDKELGTDFGMLQVANSAITKIPGFIDEQILPRLDFVSRLPISMSLEWHCFLW